MPSTHLADPLQRFPVFRTSCSEEFRHTLLTRFGASRAEMKTPTNLVARGNLVQLQSIGLVYGQSNSGATVDYPEAERFRLLTALIGNGHVAIGKNAITLDADQSCIVSPGQKVALATEASHEWFNLRIDPGAFENKLACLLGARPGRKLEFSPAANRNSPRFQQLWRLIRFFAEQLDATSEQLPPLVLRELEQTILVAFLTANRHTFSHLLERVPAIPCRLMCAGRKNSSKPIGIRRSRSKASWKQPASAPARSSGHSSKPAAIRRWLLPRWSG